MRLAPVEVGWDAIPTSRLERGPSVVRSAMLGLHPNLPLSARLSATTNRIPMHTPSHYGPSGDTKVE
jgi:hypothetical protein